MNPLYGYRLWRLSRRCACLPSPDAVGRFLQHENLWPLLRESLRVLPGLVPRGCPLALYLDAAATLPILYIVAHRVPADDLAALHLAVDHAWARGLMTRARYRLSILLTDRPPLPA